MGQLSEKLEATVIMHWFAVLFRTVGREIFKSYSTINACLLNNTTLSFSKVICFHLACPLITALLLVFLVKTQPFQGAFADIAFGIIIIYWLLYTFWYIPLSVVILKRKITDDTLQGLRFPRLKRFIYLVYRILATTSLVFFYVAILMMLMRYGYSYLHLLLAIFGATFHIHFIVKKYGEK